MGVDPYNLLQSFLSTFVWLLFRIEFNKILTTVLGHMPNISFNKIVCSISGLLSHIVG